MMPDFIYIYCLPDITVLNPVNKFSLGNSDPKSRSIGTRAAGMQLHFVRNSPTVFLFLSES